MSSDWKETTFLATIWSEVDGYGCRIRMGLRGGVSYLGDRRQRFMHRIGLCFLLHAALLFGLCTYGAIVGLTQMARSHFKTDRLESHNAMRGYPTLLPILMAKVQF
jgi:hypothetical protein